MAYIDREHIDAEAAYEVPIVGIRRPATLLTEPAFDPDGGRMRS